MKVKFDKKEQCELWSMAALPIILIFIFSYIPMYGILIAFQDYVPGISIIGDPRINWVGFKHFQTFIDGPYFSRLLKNTVWLSLLNLAFGFWIPIIFALFLNEVKQLKFKKFTQTASYMPYFISNVVVAGMFLSFLSQDGLFNAINRLTGQATVAYITKPAFFPGIYTLINVWKSFGFSSILYFSSISAIDPALYESARLDGAGRFKLMWHITLPAIKPTIAILLIMQIGSILASNVDLILLLYRPSTYRTADTIGTYIYRLGITDGRFSYTTAIGLFMTVINFTLVFIANKTSNKLTGYAMW